MGSQRASAKPAVPLPDSLAQALGQSEALSGLSRRLALSQQRWLVASQTLPPALRAQVRPGVLDDEGWTLMVSSAAAAAKLRNCLPLIEASLREAGWSTLALRIRLASK
jgi:Dna[CI] antecedent, DciA